MFRKFEEKLTHVVAGQLKCPTKSIIGRLVARNYQKRSSFLEKGAVKLAKIQPDDRVLEVGFGGGVGVRDAYWKIKDGQGMIYGVEKSHYMLERGKKYCALEIAELKVHLSLGLVTHLPFPDFFFDRVFHCNTYYYWDNLVLAAAELKRVMKPGAQMVTTVSFDELKSMERIGYFDEKSNYDPLDYMLALETVGFENVKVQYVKGLDGEEDEIFERPYEAIFATRPLLKEERLTDDSLEEEEERFRQQLTQFKAAEVSRISHRPVSSDYDPLTEKSKVPTNNDGTVVDPK